MSDSLLYLIPISLILGGVALGAFFWCLKNDQYEDLDGAAERILFEDPGNESDQFEEKTAPHSK